MAFGFRMMLAVLALVLAALVLAPSVFPIWTTAECPQQPCPACLQAPCPACLQEKAECPQCPACPACPENAPAGTAWSTYVERLIEDPLIKQFQCAAIAPVFSTMEPETYVPEKEWRKKIPLIASTSKGKCDLLGPGCLKEPYISQGIVEAAWLEHAIRVAFQGCTGAGGSKPCYALDIGANLGVISLLMLQAGGHVVSIEPQPDLCCAGRASAVWNGYGDRGVHLCGWAAFFQQGVVQPKMAEIPKTASFFRYGQFYLEGPEKKVVDAGPYDVPGNLAAKGLPMNLPFYQVGEVLLKKSYPAHFTFIKIDTDSIDCLLLEYFLGLVKVGALRFDTACLEMSGFCADLTQNARISKMFAALQAAGYILYRADAHFTQNNGFVEGFDAFPELTAKVVDVPGARILMFRNMTKEEWTEVGTAKVMNHGQGYHLLIRDASLPQFDGY